jgi:hypothetical protein
MFSVAMQIARDFTCLVPRMNAPPPSRNHFPSGFGFRLNSLILVPLLLVASQYSAPVAAESWTDLRGTRTIDARMVGMWGDNVMLELTNGRRVSVSLNSLRSDSRIQARRLSKELAKRRDVRIGELQQASIAAAAAAPDPLPIPDSAPAYQPPSKDVEVDAFLKQIDQAIEAGHLRALYDALPPSYRTDVDEVVRLAAAKVDPVDFDSIKDCLQKSGSTLVMNQNWLLSSPRIKALPESANAQVRGPLLSIAGLFHSETISDLLDLEKLKTQPFGQWLTEFDRASCDYLHEAFETSGKSISRTVTVESTQADVVRVKIASDLNESNLSFTKVDGYWVPMSMNPENWKRKIDDKKKEIEENGGKSLLEPWPGYASGLDAILEPLATARNSNDFHAAIESTVEFLTVNVPTWAGVLGIKLDFNSRDRRNYGPFDDEDY